MVKRATIHVSSRTKKRIIRKNGGIRGITKDKKRKRKNNKYNLYNILQPCRKAGCNMVLAKLLFLVVYLAEGLYTRVACFVLAKRCYLL